MHQTFEEGVADSSALGQDSGDTGGGDGGGGDDAESQPVPRWAASSGREAELELSPPAQGPQAVVRHPSDSAGAGGSKKARAGGRVSFFVAACACKEARGACAGAAADRTSRGDVSSGGGGAGGGEEEGKEGPAAARDRFVHEAKQGVAALGRQVRERLESAKKAVARPFKGLRAEAEAVAAGGSGGGGGGGGGGGKDRGGGGGGGGA